MTLAGKHVHIPKQARSKMPHAQIELLINIEAKMRAGKGKGYERWAERHNTDVLASSMLYLIDMEANYGGGANYYRLNKEFDLVTSNCLVWRIGETATVKNEKEKRI